MGLDGDTVYYEFVIVSLSISGNWIGLGIDY